MGKLSNLWDEYLVYKNIKLYPFLMKDYDLFEELISILLFDKNKIPDIKIIKMSYLKFLFFVVPYMVDESGNKVYKDIIDKINSLFKYILKDQSFEFLMDNNEKIFINVNVKDENILLTEHEFEKIRKLILCQNAIPVLDNRIHPELQAELEENMKFLSKMQGHIDGTMEDQIVSYKCEMKFDTYNLIKEMSIYQFRKELVRLDLIKDYQIYKTASMSGMVTFDSPITHWRSHISDKPDYSGLLMDKNEFDKKMNNFVQQ